MNSGEHSGASIRVLETPNGNQESLFSKTECALLIFGRDVNKQDIITGQKTENKGNGEEALKSLPARSRVQPITPVLLHVAGTEKRLNSHRSRQNLSDWAK